MNKENVLTSPSSNYKKLSQREHVLARPDTYVGSVEFRKNEMWVFDKESKQLRSKEITYVPALYKIFDEILVNAADNKQRDSSMSWIKVDIDAEKGVISVANNGKGTSFSLLLHIFLSYQTHDFKIVKHKKNRDSCCDAFQGENVHS